MMKKLKSHAAKGPTQRQMKVSEAIKRSLSDLFIRGDIATLSFNTALLSITEVSLSPDFRNSTVYVRSLLMDQGEKPAYIKELNKNKAQIRYVLAQKLDLQFATDVHFVYDTSLSHAIKIDTLLREAQSDSHEKVSQLV
jgi:ribosome-binding factor A